MQSGDHAQANEAPTEAGARIQMQGLREALAQHASHTDHAGAEKSDAGGLWGGGNRCNRSRFDKSLLRGIDQGRLYAARVIGLGT